MAERAMNSVHSIGMNRPPASINRTYCVARGSCVYRTVRGYCANCLSLPVSPTSSSCRTLCHHRRAFNRMPDNVTIEVFRTESGTLFCLHASGRRNILRIVSICAVLRTTQHRHSIATAQRLVQSDQAMRSRHGTKRFCPKSIEPERQRRRRGYGGGRLVRTQHRLSRYMYIMFSAHRHHPMAMLCVFVCGDVQRFRVAVSVRCCGAYCVVVLCGKLNGIPCDWRPIDRAAQHVCI